MSKLLVIGPENQGISTQMMVKEAQEVFSRVDYIPVNEIQLSLKKTPELLHNGNDLSRYDYCLPRIDSKRAQHGYHVIRFMDMLGMKKPYSAEAVLVAHNKFMSLEVLSKAGVPIPATYLISSMETSKRVLKKMKYPIIVKIVGGFGGIGVMVFEDPDTALSAVQTMKSLKQQIIIEEFIPNPGEDYRAFVVGGEITAAMKRISRKEDFRANIHLGGRGEYITLGDEMKDIALQAAAAVNSDIIAIDMIDAKDGPKVIEVNLNPGIKGIQKASNMNIGKAIISFIQEKLSV